MASARSGSTIVRVVTDPSSNSLAVTATDATSGRAVAIANDLATTLSNAVNKQTSSDYDHQLAAANVAVQRELAQLNAANSAFLRSHSPTDQAAADAARTDLQAAQGNLAKLQSSGAPRAPLTTLSNAQVVKIISVSGIQAPKDLEGKKVGVRAYSVTTGVWTRCVLIDEFGLDSSKVTWVVDDEEHVQALKLPPNVVNAPENTSLVEMMAKGEISAGFSGNAGLGPGASVPALSP